MQTTSLPLGEAYDYTSEKFQKAFTFLRTANLAALPVGNVAIDGEEVYANVPPEDAHAPRRQTEPGGCPVKKIVVRVRI